MIVVAVAGAALIACGAEMIRPRAAGEKLEDRPGRALVVGQFDIALEGFEENAGVDITRHRVMVGDDEKFFVDHVPVGGRTFAVWVYPGVFCFGRPRIGEGTSAKVLGEGAPCAEIPEAETAYYVGSVTWRVTKVGDEASADLEVENHKESVMAARNLAGIYPETALVKPQKNPEKTAAQYELP